MFVKNQIFSCLYKTFFSPKQALQTHEKSEGHQKCVKRKVALEAKPGEMPAHRAIQQLSLVEKKKMSVLFNIAHAIGKNNRPFLDYSWQLQLYEKTAANSFGKTYRNDKACKKFISYIAEAE
jgi:hypothetical protein